MTAKETTPIVPFVVVAVLLLGVIGYLGWRWYDSPVDEHAAGIVAVQATNVLVRASGGDANMCRTLQDIAAPDQAEGTVRRCGEIARQAGSVGPGWLGVRDLQPTGVDVGRHSGKVTVSGTLLTQGPAFPLSLTWPVKRVDGAWVISGEPDVDIG